MNWLKDKLDNIYYFFKDRFDPYNVIKIKTLGIHYCDPDEQMLHANFQILTDFVENQIKWGKESGHDYFDLSEDIKQAEYEDEINQLKRHQTDRDELMALYNWWKKYSKDEIDSLDSIEAYEIEEEMLIRLMKIRGCIWY